MGRTIVPTRTTVSYAPAVRPLTSVAGLATISVLLGSLTALVAAAQPVGDGATQGFVICSTGATAIVTGVQALQRGRWGSPRPRAAARLGIGLGVLGSAAMVYTLAAFLLMPLGIAAPPLPSLASATGVAAPLDAVPVPAPPVEVGPGAPPPVPAAQVSPPAVMAVPATPDDERRLLVQALGGMATALDTMLAGGAAPPRHLVVQESGVATISTSDGFVLGTVPLGTDVSVGTRPDGTGVVLELLGVAHGTWARYDTTTGVITAG